MNLAIILTCIKKALLYFDETQNVDVNVNLLISTRRVMTN